MVAPRLAEGALRNVADLSKKTGLEQARRERYGGGILGSETPRSISNQDNCHVPGAGFSLPCFSLGGLIFKFSLGTNAIPPYCASI